MCVCVCVWCNTESHPGENRAVFKDGKRKSRATTAADHSANRGYCNLIDRRLLTVGEHMYGRHSFDFYKKKMGPIVLSRWRVNVFEKRFSNLKIANHLCNQTWLVSK